MRSDMHKIIVERPRFLRARWKNKKTALRLTQEQSAEAMEAAEDYDSGPGRASSRRHEKWLNENLAPLWRYLERQVGRPWNKVYGEIKETIDTRSAIGLHVLQHMKQYVVTDAFLHNGVVCEWHWRGGAVPVTGLYVHPKTGLLRMAKPKKEPVAPAPVEVIRISPTLQLEKFNGLWFRVEYRLLPLDVYGQVQRVIQRKEQCGRKTIRCIESGELTAALQR